MSPPSAICPSFCSRLREMGAKLFALLSEPIQKEPTKKISLICSSLRVHSFPLSTLPREDFSSSSIGMTPLSLLLSILALLTLFGGANPMCNKCYIFVEDFPVKLKKLQKDISRMTDCNVSTFVCRMRPAPPKMRRCFDRLKHSKVII